MHEVAESLRCRKAWMSVDWDTATRGGKGKTYAAAALAEVVLATTRLAEVGDGAEFCEKGAT